MPEVQEEESVGEKKKNGKYEEETDESEGNDNKKATVRFLCNCISVEN